MAVSTCYVLVVAVLVSGCCAYVNVTDTADAQDTAVSHGRRFSWALDWLAGSGFFGQIIANVVVALFILPPLGPYVCAFLDNCDSLKLTHARATPHQSTPRAIRSDGDMTERLIEVLKNLEKAYEKYT